ITDTNIYVTFELTEPLLLSPFYIRFRLWEARLLRDSVYKVSDGHERKRESRVAECTSDHYRA
ncbi:MAG: hypothetical protein ACKPKO_03740, partial [Candidatus Fonsibacter sp.]